MNAPAPSGFSIYAGSLILVNAAHPYRGRAPMDALAPVERGGGPLLERRAAALLELLMAEILGWTDIVAVSGWRSSREQAALWKRSLRENGEAFTRQYVAEPGHSEHESGLAIDLGLRTDAVDPIRPDFPDSGVCRIFRKKLHRYGFIERYPAEKESVTGIAHEPWHFRYVGVPHAGIMAQERLTLEEYHAYLNQYPYDGERLPVEAEGRRWLISHLDGARAAAVIPALLASPPCLLSGDNADGFIVTQLIG